MFGKLIAFTVGATAVAGLLVWLFKELGETSSEDKLKSCFKNHIYTDVFTYEQMRGWIHEREHLIKNNCKALVTKINSASMQEIFKMANIVDVGLDNYLAIVIMNNEIKNIEDSVLIKYGTLDARLEEVLAKGNGTLVVGG